MILQSAKCCPQKSKVKPSHLGDILRLIVGFMDDADIVQDHYIYSHIQNLHSARRKADLH